MGKFPQKDTIGGFSTIVSCVLRMNWMIRAMETKNNVYLLKLFEETTK